LRTSDFDYELPPEFIAQTPVEPRHASRLLVLERGSGAIQHTSFWEIGRYLQAGDVLVINETRVIPARLFARKVPGGGKIELLLLHKEDDCTWEALVGGKGLIPGKRLVVVAGLQAEITAVLGGPRRLVRFTEPIEPYLAAFGHVPLPPYIHTPLADPERYQTVYARQDGSGSPHSRAALYSRIDRPAPAPGSRLYPGHPARWIRYLRSSDGS
jgi:S-adenosylmethionine:tRNA ribosyltransferase-isomerase